MSFYYWTAAGLAVLAGLALAGGIVLNRLPRRNGSALCNLATAASLTALFALYLDAF